MDEEAAKKLIVEKLEKKKGKSKFYLKDFYKMLPDLISWYECVKVKKVEESTIVISRN